MMLKLNSVKPFNRNQFEGGKDLSNATALDDLAVKLTDVNALKQKLSVTAEVTRVFPALIK